MSGILTRTWQGLNRRRVPSDAIPCEPYVVTNACGNHFLVAASSKGQAIEAALPLFALARIDLGGGMSIQHPAFYADGMRAFTLASYKELWRRWELSDRAIYANTPPA